MSNTKICRREYLAKHMNVIHIDFDDARLIKMDASDHTMYLEFDSVFCYENEKTIDEYIVRISFKKFVTSDDSVNKLPQRIFNFSLQEYGKIKWFTLVPCPVDIASCELNFNFSDSHSLKLVANTACINVVNKIASHQRKPA